MDAGPSCVVHEPMDFVENIHEFQLRTGQILFGRHQFRTEPGETTRIDQKSIRMTLVGRLAPVVVKIAFKRVLRVNVLDDAEGQGAGLILEVDWFCAKVLNAQIDQVFPLRGRFLIIMEVVEFEMETVNKLINVLHQAQIEQLLYLSERKKPVPDRILYQISYYDWCRAVLMTGRGSYCLEVKKSDGHFVTVYRIAKIVEHATITLIERGYMTVQDILAPFPSKKVGLKSTTDRGISNNVKSSPVFNQRANDMPKLDTYSDIMKNKTTMKASTVVATYETPDSTYNITYKDLTTLSKEGYLNDTIIEFCLQYIKHNVLPEHVRSKTHIFNPFFYTRLTQGIDKAAEPTSESLKQLALNYKNVNRWTRKVNIFSMDYLVVPINEDLHWYMAVVVRPASAIGCPETVSDPKFRPSIYLLDSLMDDGEHSKQTRVAAVFLTNYLKLHYDERRVQLGVPDLSFNQNAFLQQIPRGIPQQTNHYDCGIFLIEFMEKFLTSNVKDEADHNKTFKEMFGTIDVSGKRSRLRNLILSLRESERVDGKSGTCLNNNENELVTLNEDRSQTDHSPDPEVISEVHMANEEWRSVANPTEDVVDMLLNGTSQHPTQIEQSPPRLIQRPTFRALDVSNCSPEGEQSDFWKSQYQCSIADSFVAESAFSTTSEEVPEQSKDSSKQDHEMSEPNAVNEKMLETAEPECVDEPDREVEEELNGVGESKSELTDDDCAVNSMSQTLTNGVTDLLLLAQIATHSRPSSELDLTESATSSVSDVVEEPQNRECVEVRCEEAAGSTSDETPNQMQQASDTESWPSLDGTETQNSGECKVEGHEQHVQSQDQNVWENEPTESEPKENPKDLAAYVGFFRNDLQQLPNVTGTTSKTFRNEAGDTVVMHTLDPSQVKTLQ